MARGGARPGCGRKKSEGPLVAVNWVITPESKEWMKNRTVGKKKTIAELIEEMIKATEEIDDLRVLESQYQ